MNRMAKHSRSTASTRTGRWIMLREAAPPGPGRHRRPARPQRLHRPVRVDGAPGARRAPPARGHHTEGLLDESTYVVRLLNPATRHLAELPTLDPLLPRKTTRANISEYSSLAYELKVTGIGVVFDDGDGSTATLAISFFTPRMLVVARPGDGHWTLIDSQQWFFSAMSFSGRFYCAKAGAVMALEAAAATTTTTSTNHNQGPPRLVVVAEITCRVSLMCRDTVHLVESDGRLLLLRRWLQSQGKMLPL